MQDHGGHVLVPGSTCWRIERAERFALIIDAAEYFRFAKKAMLNARRRIMLIGWDFDVRIEFEPQEQTLEGPNRLGDFLSWLPDNRPGLHVYLLKWDLGVLQALGRGMAPIFIRNWTSGKRLQLRLDGVHPAGAAHHQKIVVIDDAFAFCGGIDITVDRWDTRMHRDDEPCRIEPNGERHGPWHDATTAIDGKAGRAIGELARARWGAATGEELEPVPEGSDPWPDGLAPVIERVPVGIARTLPELEERAAVTEIEALYLRAIASARRSIYIETQYLASRRLARALADRLSEAEGPEVVLVLPKSAEGWLEQQAMDGARVALLRMLREADLHRRFGAFHPVTEGGAPIYVHAKIMTIDDRLLRVGSSNLNNRSLTFDTECDLVLEAAGNSSDDGRLRATIVAIRNSLLSEHLGTGHDVFGRTLAETDQSLLQAIEKLRGTGRTLHPFDIADLDEDESPLAENELLDPEQRSASTGRRFAVGLRQLAAGLLPRASSSR